MKRRLLSAFLAVMMVLTMAPVAFAAEDTAENTLPPTIEQDTTLNDNYTADITVPAGKTVTLDLGGHTLTNTGSGKATLSVAGNATVKNGTIIGGSSYYNIEVKTGGSLTLKNVTATAGNNGSSMIDNWGTLTITSGTYTGGLNVVKSEEGSTFNICGGKFTLDYSVSGYTGVILNYGTATINDGEFVQNATSGRWNHPQVVATGMVEGYTAITKITGGTFTNNKSDESIFHGIGKGTSDNFEVSGGNFNKSVSSSYLKDGLVCKKNTTTGMYELTTGATGVTLSESEKTIKVGESFKLEATLTPEDAELKSVTWKESSKGKIATVNKNNGTVKGIAIGDVTITATPNAAGATPATCKVHVYDEAAQIGETIYPTLEQAIAAVQSGETIKLLKNIQVSKTIEVNKDFSIDLNGFTLTGKSGSSGCRVFTVANGGKLTLTGTGAVTVGGSIKNGSSSSVIDVAEGGALAIGEKVTITTGHCNGISVAGTAEMNGTVEVTKSGFHAVTSTGTATIKKGYYNGSFEGTVTISGGYFTVDPSAYCVTGKTGVSSGDSTYPWTVGEKIANTKPAEVADATVAATVDKNASEAAKDAAKDIGGATMAQNEAIKAAAKNEANKNTIEPTTQVEGNKTVTDKLKAALPTGTTVSDSDVKIVYQTYIDVEVKDAAKENNNFTELTVELTPMYRVIAAKSGVTDYNVDVDKNTSKDVNAVQIVGEKPLTLTGKYKVTLQLPNGFVVPTGNKLSVKHEKTNGSVEYYTGTVSKNGQATILTFTTNGFSPFTIYANVAAYIDGTAYPTLQAAADAAKSTDVISVKSGASHELNFTTTKSVKVKNDTGVAITVKFNGTNKDVAKDATETFSYTKPSSGGSSGGSSSGKTTYKVTTSAVNNGGINASPSSAEKGATITITLSPDKGYKLDKLTVTDGSGKTVSTVKKSDTVYTFTMPASAVNVGVSYIKATETPSKTKFNDVSANAWFASAVDYVTGKGMMNGTADNTFSPKANTTRGMVVTVLYRLENQPSTSAASFTDVASGAYYANAVAWANANGIVSGYGSGKFGPNDKVTREQLAAILYRYAQYKKYDVSGANSLDGYTDAQSVSSYAVPALQWANAAGVVTGKSGNKLDPKGNATRAEVAAMLMRFCENVK